MVDPQDSDCPGAIVDRIDQPIRPTASTELAFELATERLTDSARVASEVTVSKFNNRRDDPRWYSIHVANSCR
jgi:hypothetical protein